MTTFLQKLDRAAESLVNMIDNQLQGTTVRVITGEVFNGDESVQCAIEDTSAGQDAPLTTLPVRPTRDSRKPDTSVYPPVLRKANATHK